jgi:hypothetical protein
MNGPAFDEGLVLPTVVSPMDREEFRFVNGKVHLSIPAFGSLDGNWEPEERERQAAWELYVELITHISVAELEPKEEILGERMTALYLLYDTSREILRKYGPELGRPNARSSVSFATLAMAAMGYVLQPILAKWHPRLASYEATRPPSVPSVEWEAKWEHAQELRWVLQRARRTMIEYADVLALAAKISPVHHGAISAGGGATNGHC